MTHLPAEWPGTPAVLDITKPLFDVHGNLHSVILSAPFQLLTSFRGLLFVWDKGSGESLMQAESGDRLSNFPLPVGGSNRSVTYEERREMVHSTMVIDCLRRSSRAEIKAKAKRRRDADSAGGFL